MDLTGKKFTLNKARVKLTDEITDREMRRKGQIVKIMLCEIGTPLLFEYGDGGVLRTSLVETITQTGNVLGVHTMNTYYEFIELGA